MGQGESRRRWELEGALREAATIFKRELCNKNETLRTLQSELRCILLRLLVAVHAVRFDLWWQIDGRFYREIQEQ